MMKASIEGAPLSKLLIPPGVASTTGMSYAGSQVFSSGAVMAPGLRLPSQGETPAFQGPVCQLCCPIPIRAIATIHVEWYPDQ
jgi:hypothetical protein